MSRGRDRRKKQARRWTSSAPSDPARVDGTLAALAEFVERRYGEIFQAELVRRLRRLDKPALGATLAPADAAALFEKHYEAIQDLAVRATLPLSAFGWLWYLRRLPDDVFGWGADLPSTAPYDRALAEIVSARSVTAFADDPGRIVAGSVIYPMDEGLIEHVLRFCARISLMSDVERQYRRAAKGSSFVVGESYLDRVADPVLDEAIRVHDLRAMDEELPVGAGSETLRVSIEADEAGQWRHVVLLAFPRSEIGIALRDRRAPGPDKDTVYFGQYVPSYAAVDPLLDLLDQARAKARPPVEAGLPELIALLSVFGWEVFIRRDEHIHLATQRTGYVLRRFELFDVAYAELLPSGLQTRIEHAFDIQLPKTGRELVESLRQLDFAPRPLIHGPVIRDVDDDKFVVDLRMATHRIMSAGTGVLRSDTVFRNTVANSFEQLTRRIVDQEGKTPSSALAPLVGRVITRNGNAITDLDAIAELPGGVVLLISCKSVAGTPGHVAGLHAPTRNTAERLESDVVQWKRIVAELTQFPIGDNYDFSGRSMLGVVVTPRLQWAGSGVAHEIAAERADGRTLRWVSSLSELQGFLSG